MPDPPPPAVIPNLFRLGQTDSTSAQGEGEEGQGWPSSLRRRRGHWKPGAQGGEGTPQAGASSSGPPRGWHGRGDRMPRRNGGEHAPPRTPRSRYSLCITQESHIMRKHTAPGMEGPSGPSRGVRLNQRPRRTTRSPVSALHTGRGREGQGTAGDTATPQLRREPLRTEPRVPCRPPVARRYSDRRAGDRHTPRPEGPRDGVFPAPAAQPRARVRGLPELLPRPARDTRGPGLRVLPAPKAV